VAREGILPLSRGLAYCGQVVAVLQIGMADTDIQGRAKKFMQCGYKLVLAKQIPIRFFYLWIQLHSSTSSYIRSKKQKKFFLKNWRPAITGNYAVSYCCVRVSGVYFG
jgi:hypothetical protein